MKQHDNHETRKISIFFIISPPIQLFLTRFGDDAPQELDDRQVEGTITMDDASSESFQSSAPLESAEPLKLISSMKSLRKAMIM